MPWDFFFYCDHFNVTFVALQYDSNKMTLDAEHLWWEKTFVVMYDDPQ